MPLDFSLWEDIEARMVACAPKGKETIAAFKIRLRKIALATLVAVVRKAVSAMKTRAAAIADASGGHISRD